MHGPATKKPRRRGDDGDVDRAVKVVVEGTGRPLGAVEASPTSRIGFRRNFGRHRHCIREFGIAIVMCGSTFSAPKAIEECGETGGETETTWQLYVCAV
jgi:hypothetical protein